MESEACGLGGASVNSMGSGSCGPLYFAATTAAEIRGQRLENKICELCGVNFFRDANAVPLAKECKRCAVKLATPKEPIPPADGPEEDVATHRLEMLRIKREARRAAVVTGTAKKGPQTEEARKRCGNFTRGENRRGNRGTAGREQRQAAIAAAMRTFITVVQ